MVRVNAAPNTTAGAYSINIEGRGTNGTPVHRRTVALTIGLVGIEGVSEIPNNYELSQNFPNPFNPTTKINYNLKAQTHVKITVFDAMGRLISSLNEGVQEPGSHFITFNGATLSTGVYYYRLETAFFTDTKKMLLIK